MKKKEAITHKFKHLALTLLETHDEIFSRSLHFIAHEEKALLDAAEHDDLTPREFCLLAIKVGLEQARAGRFNKCLQNITNKLIEETQDTKDPLGFIARYILDLVPLFEKDVKKTMKKHKKHTH